jgi:hypothetical protein
MKHAGPLASLVEKRSAVILTASKMLALPTGNRAVTLRPNFRLILSREIPYIARR